MALHPALQTEWLFTIDVTIGPPQPIGLTEAGERTDYPITGGRFAGPALTGDVVPGGADYFLMRLDNVGVLDARYRLRAADGTLIEIRNRGLWVPDAAGLARLRAGAEPEANELYCRCVPEFTAPPGPHDWLNRIVVAGTVEYPQPFLVRVGCFKLL